MAGQPRVLRDLPHPVLFTRGSRWRFIAKRIISDTGHHFSPGDEIRCETPINNVSKTLACSGDIHRFLRRSDETMYGKHHTVRGTVNLNTIYRFVERVEAGTPVIYYLCKTFVKDGSAGFGYYYSGKDKNYPNVNDFSEAAYWENRLLALKALFRQNGFGTRRKYEHYKLMSYDARTDQHAEVSTTHIRPATDWLHEQIGQRVHKTDIMRALSDAVLKNFDTFKGLIAVRMPGFGVEDQVRVIQYCTRQGIRQPIVFVDRLAFFESIEDAMLVKMGMASYEVVTC